MPAHNFWYTDQIFIKIVKKVCEKIVMKVVNLKKLSICKKFQVNLIIFGSFTDQNTKIESGLKLAMDYI